jgi:hypothetical protein
MSKLSEARATAKEAYVFFRSMIDQYRLRLARNQVPNKFYPFFPSTPIAVSGVMKLAFLDTRGGPVILNTPDIDPNYYFTVLCIDQWAHNFAYFGTRNTGNSSAKYLISGPDWQGSKPSDINVSATAEGNFTTMMLSLESQDPDGDQDDDYINKIVDECTLTKLNVELPQPVFPEYDTHLHKKADVFKYVNFYLQFSSIYPPEKKFYDRFAEIGIVPGGPWPPINCDPSLYEAIGQGVWEAASLIDAERDRQVNDTIGGWEYICGLLPPLVGNRAVMKDRYLARAGEALSTFEWPDSPEASINMQARQDDQFEALNGGCDYVLTWKKEDLPQTNPIGYWSFTVYTKKGAPIDVPNNAISSNSKRLVYNQEGGVTIYILAQKPDDVSIYPSDCNILVSPDSGEFQIFLRIFWPYSEHLKGQYAPPLPVKTPFEDLLKPSN